jgi:hypothetical protein
MADKKSTYFQQKKKNLFSHKKKENFLSNQSLNPDERTQEAFHLVKQKRCRLLSQL